MTVDTPWWHRSGDPRVKPLAGDRIGALGLVLNALMLFDDTRCTDAALTRLRADGFDVRDEEVGRLDPR